MSLKQCKTRMTIYSLLTLLIFGLFQVGCATGPPVQVTEEQKEVKQPTIEDIRVTTARDRSSVKIANSMETPHTGIKLMNPPRIYIDLKGMPAASLSRLIEVNKGLIKNIRVQERQDQAYITRVEVALSNEGLEYNIDSQGSNIFLNVIQPQLEAPGKLKSAKTMKTEQAKKRPGMKQSPSTKRPAKASQYSKYANYDKYKKLEKRASGKSAGTSKEKGTPQETETYADASALADYAGQKMSFDFVDTDIRNVLKLIAEAMGINIVWGKEVTGTISLKLDNVPWDQALEMILKPSDLTYQIEGNVMWVVPRSKLIDMELREKERRKALLAQKRIEDIYQAKVIEFVKVRYRKVATVFRLMAQVMDVSGAKIEVEEKGEEEAKKAKLFERDVFATFDKATNIIIIHGIRSKVEKIKSLITQLDVPEYQVMIEARIVDATTTFARDLGVQWNTLTQQRQSDTGVAFGTDPTQYTGPQQVLGSGSFSSNSPANWAANIGLFLGRLGAGQLSALTLDASLALAEEEGKTRIISAPKVIASSGQKALISRGDVLIIPATEQVPAQEIEATLSLTVTPTISSRDSISLDVTVTDDNAISITQILEKKVQTKFMVKSGETVVIGGIYTQDDANSNSGIPVLKKIPLLGWLFKADRKTNDKTELLIFLTATIVPIHRVPEGARAAQLP